MKSFLEYAEFWSVSLNKVNNGLVLVSGVLKLTLNSEREWLWCTCARMHACVWLDEQNIILNHVVLDH